MIYDEFSGFSKISNSDREGFSRLKKKLLVPLTISMLLLLSSSVLFFIYIQKNIIEQATDQLHQNSRQYLKYELEQEADEIAAHLIHLSENKDIQKAWKSQSREELLSITEPIYASMYERFDITHFYFISVTDTCYLRVHDPSRYGDEINRFTFQKSKETSKPY